MIEELREEIDEIDEQILELLNRRAELAVSIGQVKTERSLPLVDEERERELLEELTGENPGPLPEEAVARIFKRIVEETREFELNEIEGSPSSEMERQGGRGR